MALPQAETGVMELVKEEEQATARAEAIAAAIPAAATPATSTEVVTTTPSVKEQAVALASNISAANPLGFLQEHGITGIKIDSFSFPTINLNNGTFNSPEQERFGTTIDFVFIDQRPQWLFSADRGRDKDPYLAYSNDKLTEAKTGRPIAELLEEWKAEGLKPSCDEYLIIVGNAIDGPHIGEIIQLQVSPASISKWGGYLYGLGIKKIDPRTITTQAHVGPSIGSGPKAFNPWLFKQV